MRVLKHILFIFVCNTVFAHAMYSQKPVTKMHRIHDTTKHESGWYYAQSTEGHFSALLPLPFNDFSVTVLDSAKKQVKTNFVGCKSDDGFQFAVMQAPLRNKNPDFKKLMKDFDATEIKEEHKPGYESVFFKISAKKRYAFAKYIVTNGCFYMMSAECLIETKTSLDKIYLTFFNSLKVE